MQLVEFKLLRSTRGIILHQLIKWNMNNICAPSSLPLPTYFTRSKVWMQEEASYKINHGVTVHNNLSLETTRNQPEREGLQKLQDFLIM